MANGLWRMAAAVVMTMLVAPPAIAQFSDSYRFLKAVRDRDGNVATELASQAGSTIVNARDASGETALHIVVKRRDATWVEYLLAKGAQPNANDREGRTPLLLASQLGFADGAQLLLRRGASVDLDNNQGETPLMFAVRNRDMAMVRILLAAGADPKRADRTTGLTPRDYAERDARAGAILRMLDEAKPAAKRAISGPTM